MSDIQQDHILSSACTKTGAFILLLSILIVTFSFQWHSERYKKYAFKYLQYRWALKMYLELLETNPCWESYLKDNNEAESLPIKELKKLHCKIVPEKLYADPIKNIDKDKSSKNATGIFAPEIYLSMPILEINQIIKIFSSIQDNSLLLNTQKVSYFFNEMIDRWLIKRNTIYYDQKTLHEATYVFIEPNKKKRMLIKKTEIIINQQVI